MLEIALNDPLKAYRPGDHVRGTVTSDREVSNVRVELVFLTTGVVFDAEEIPSSVVVEAPLDGEATTFAFDLILPGDAAPGFATTWGGEERKGRGAVDRSWRLRATRGLDTTSIELAVEAAAPGTSVTALSIEHPDPNLDKGTFSTTIIITTIGLPLFVVAVLSATTANGTTGIGWVIVSGVVAFLALVMGLVMIWDRRQRSTLDYGSSTLTLDHPVLRRGDSLRGTATVDTARPCELWVDCEEHRPVWTDGHDPDRFDTLQRSTAKLWSSVPLVLDQGTHRIDIAIPGDAVPTVAVERSGITWTVSLRMIDVGDHSHFPTAAVVVVA